MWIKTENLVREALQDGGLNYIEIPGEAAFYGPKIDVQVWSVIGREFTLATNQVDFAIPARFNLTYKDSKDTDKTPLCIHRAPLSTHERFVGFLIEHFAGDFPLWMSPVQVMVIPISDKFNEYAEQVQYELKANGIRAKIDTRNEKMGAKIRNAEINKIPLMSIVGEKEVADKSVSIRRRFTGNMGTMPLESFVEALNKEVIGRVKTENDKDVK